MRTITITRESQTDPLSFHVVIKDDNGKTEHKVTVTTTHYEKLTSGRITPDKLVEESFEFLLEREPKESILHSFDLTKISEYFPEYETEMKKIF